MAITAVVSNGNLLIELDDGTVVNAGRVKGETGPIGLQGREGLRGSPGRDGRDGRDGASIRTGLGAPNPDDYSDGDIYIDVQTVDLLLYQKINGQWARLGSLKGQPGAPGANGRDGTGNGSRPPIIIDGGGTGTPPTEHPDPDGNGSTGPLEPGDIWLDIENGYIWIYDGTNWLPIADHPPAIISPTPPDFNNSSDGTTNYPVIEGDLWFDSDQLALYVAAQNVDGDLVWIISTPANRSGVPEAVNPFKFPRAADGEIAYNSLTDTYYIYNAPKKQWIDLPKNCQTADYTYKGTGADPAEGEFKLVSGDANQSTVALYGDKTPFIEVDSILTIADEPYQVTAITYNETTGITEVSITPGLENLIVDDTYTFSSCGPIKDEYLGRYGDRVTDATDTSQYSWNTDTEFLVPEDLSIKFNPEIPKDGWGVKLSNNNLDYKLTVGTKNTNINTDTAVVSGADYIYLAAGSSSLDLRSSATSDPLVKIESTNFIVETTESIELDAAADININAGATSGKEAIDRTIDDTSDPKQITNKEYVDAQDQILANQIIELEENIDAITETVERGSWVFTDSGAVGTTPGKFTAYDQYVAISGNPETLVSNIQSLWFHSIDTSGTRHGFDNVEEGNLLELFVQGSAEYGLFQVKEVHNYTGGAGDYWVIDVDFLRTLEQTTRFANDDICRLKIFEAPTGGDAGEFVKKTGDEMSGPLKLETAQEDENYSTISGQARVIFENTKPSDNSIKAVNLFQPGDKNALVTNADFYTKGDLFTTGYIKAWDGSSNNIPNPRVHLGSTTGYLRWGSFQELSWDNTGGSLMTSNNTKLQWTHDGVMIHKPLADNTSGNGFIVKGRVNTGDYQSDVATDVNGDLLKVYHTASGQDAIIYNGKIVNNKHIATKEYVDNTAAGGFIFASATFPLIFTSSSSLLESTGGNLCIANNNILYRKSAAGRVMPELKVGDQLRVITQNGDVHIRNITAVQGMVGDYFNVAGPQVSNPAVPLVDGEVYDFNFMFK